jgi:hypothetical protein
MWGLWRAANIAKKETAPAFGNMAVVDVKEWGKDGSWNVKIKLDLEHLEVLFVQMLVIWMSIWLKPLRTFPILRFGIKNCIECGLFRNGAAFSILPGKRCSTEVKEIIDFCARERSVTPDDVWNNDVSAVIKGASAKPRTERCFLITEI